MAGDEDEAQLIARAANGDDEAFAALFQRYYSMIHAFAYRLSLTPSDAQEIAQETFIKAARSLTALGGASSFQSWLYRIARNAAMDLLRSRARRERLTDAVLRTEAPGTTPDFAPVHDALAALTPSLREAIVLTFFEEMNHAQAAAVLGCAETTISWRVFMAKRKLKKLLSGQPHE